MATLLNGVNEILKRVSIIAGDSAALTSLTDSARQTPIDIAVQVINEANDELYSTVETKPQEQAESTITLVTNDRSYALASDLVQLKFPLIDKTNNQFITEYPGGYDQMLIDDPEQDDTGLPLFAAISPVNGELHLDRAPTSTENGRVYTYQYDKDIVLSAASDTMPFTAMVFRAMVPAYVELWKRDRQQDFDSALFNVSIGRAARLLSQNKARRSWFPR